MMRSSGSSSSGGRRRLSVDSSQTVTCATPAPAGPAGGLATTVAELKPRLRGWLHAYAAAVSIATGAALIVVATVVRGVPGGATTSIYCATVTLLFGTSALYHRLNWNPA